MPPPPVETPVAVVAPPPPAETPAPTPAPTPAQTPDPAPPAAAAAAESGAGAEPPEAGPKGEKPDTPRGSEKPVKPVKPGSPEDVCAAPGDDGTCQGLMTSDCDILGTDASDWLVAEDGGQVICGLGGDDWIDGGDGDDVLVGGEGDDELDGKGGRDCLVGGPGLDRALPERDAGVDEQVDAESPGPRKRSAVTADGTCVPAEPDPAPSVDADAPPAPSGDAEFTGGGIATATSVDSSPIAPFLLPGTRTKRAGRQGDPLPVYVVARGAVKVGLECIVGPAEGSVVILDRRRRRLTKPFPVRCTERDFLTSELRLTKRGRRALRRGDVRAVLRVEVGAQVSEREILLERRGG
ncbi:MAG TPA: hypothetical protein VF533_02340 [Solirubrobacteraceae bacterium]